MDRWEKARRIISVQRSTRQQQRKAITSATFNSKMVFKMSAAGLDAETKATKTGDCSNDDSVMLITCFNSSKSALRVR